MPLPQGQIRLPERSLDKGRRLGRNYAKRNYQRGPDQTPWSPIVNTPVMDINGNRRGRTARSLATHGTNLDVALMNGTRGTRRVVGEPASRTFHDTRGTKSLVEEYLGGKNKKTSKRKTTKRRTSKRRTYKNKK